MWVSDIIIIINIIIIIIVIAQQSNSSLRYYHNSITIRRCSCSILMFMFAIQAIFELKMVIQNVRLQLDRITHLLKPDCTIISVIKGVCFTFALLMLSLVFAESSRWCARPAWPTVFMYIFKTISAITGKNYAKKKKQNINQRSGWLWKVFSSLLLAESLFGESEPRSRYKLQGDMARLIQT